MLTLRETARFRKDLKLAKKRGKNLDLLRGVIRTLCEEKPLDHKYLDHPLKGKFIRYRECHIENDWLFVYTVDKGSLILTAAYTGAHSDIFG